MTRTGSGRRRAAAMLAALGLGTGLAACGSSSTSSSSTTTPAGLQGTTTTVSASAQESAEQVSANSTLAPEPGSFLYGKHTVKLVASTTPANGDINPYALITAQTTAGSVHAGDVLVDNFNNKSNEQGTGTTIVDVHPTGKVTVFADIPKDLPGCPGGIGLTNAMVQLKTGWVIVGSLPSKNGQVATAGDGCLIVLSSTGKVVKTITGSYVNGPWDTTLADNGDTAWLIYSNTHIGVHGNATVPTYRGDIVRMGLAQSATSAPHVTSVTVIASGFGERGDSSVFVKGPAGLALAANGTLYASDTIGNRIVKIPQALTRTSSDGTGQTIAYAGQLSQPLGMVFAPNGNLLTVNALNGKVVEVTTAGKQVGEYYADDNVGQSPRGNGDLFDVAVSYDRRGVLFVNDGNNTLEVLH